MATPDKDGRIAQLVSDLHACLVMELAEHARETAADFEREMAKVQAVLDGASGSNLEALRRAAEDLRKEGEQQ